MRVSIAICPLFYGFAELLLLSAYELLPLTSLALSYLLKLCESLHLILSLLLFLVCQASLPLLPLDFNVFCTIFVLLSL